MDVSPEMIRRDLTGRSNLPIFTVDGSLTETLSFVGNNFYLSEDCLSLVVTSVRVIQPTDTEQERCQTVSSTVDERPEDVSEEGLEMVIVVAGEGGRGGVGGSNCQYSDMSQVLHYYTKSLSSRLGPLTSNMEPDSQASR